MSKFCDFESQICQLVGSLRVARGVVSTGGFSLVLAGGEFGQVAKKRGGSCGEVLDRCERGEPKLVNSEFGEL